MHVEISQAGYITSNLFVLGGDGHGSFVVCCSVRVGSGSGELEIRAEVRRLELVQECFENV